jgi:hypothetical protein
MEAPTSVDRSYTGARGIGGDPVGYFPSRPETVDAAVDAWWDGLAGMQESCHDPDAVRWLLAIAPAHVAVFTTSPTAESLAHSFLAFSASPASDGIREHWDARAVAATK